MEKNEFNSCWQFLSTYGVIKKDIENSSARDTDVNVKK